MKTTNLGQDTKFDTLPPEMVLKIFIMLPSYGAMNTPTYCQAVYKGNNTINAICKKRVYKFVIFTENKYVIQIAGWL